MKAEEFQRLWISPGDTLERFDDARIGQIDLSRGEKEFLVRGLPSEAAPYLRFGPSSGANLQSAADEYGLDEGFNVYRIIGFNAYGDPICLDINDGAIIYLNRDDEFGYIFVNSSMSRLAHFLVLFRTLVEDLKSKASDKRRELADTTIESMRVIDLEAVEEGGWIDEVESLV